MISTRKTQPQKPQVCWKLLAVPVASQTDGFVDGITISRWVIILKSAKLAEPAGNEIRVGM